VIGPWERIEGSSHDDELDAGVEARVADPLWMLARQWQVGELRGDDAGSPITARLAWTATRLTSYRPGTDGPVVPIPTRQPLERVVEAAPAPSAGSARLHWSARLGAQLVRRLSRRRLDDVVAALRDAVGAPVENDALALPGAGTMTVQVLARRALDGAALLAARDATVQEALAGLPADRRTAGLEVIDEWRARTRSRFATPPVDTWDDHRLEHRFSVAAGASASETVLTAAEYTGGHLDWYSFDVDPAGRHQPESDERDPGDEGDEGDAGVVHGDVSAIPTPIRYAGQPAARWWAFEEGNAHFGDIAAAPGDLGRLLLADYATVYGNDWCSVPLRLPIGTIVRVDGLTVFDTMGRRTDIPPAALLDHPRGDRPSDPETTGPADRSQQDRRPFRLYELDGDPSVAAGLAPLLFLPPTVSGSDAGPALERVELVRDEAANLAWGIERFVEGPTGRAVDRLQHWRTSTSTSDGERTNTSTSDGEAISGGPSTPGTGGHTPGGARTAPDHDLPEPTPGQGIPMPTPGPGPADPSHPPPEQQPGQDAWRYRLEATAPPFWIPFVPARSGSGAQVRLRRARMQEWELLDRSLVGAKGELLQPRRPMAIEEEEVPSGGVTVERRWQTARWVDGSMHVWLQRSKTAGHGERSSGVRWDILEEAGTD